MLNKMFPPQVTLLHVESEQEPMSSHSFRVDSSVKNVTLHITGFMTECILTDPLGNCRDKSHTQVSTSFHYHKSAYWL